MEFSGQRRTPSGYQRSLWREDVGCIENRRATDVVLKASARWNRTGYAVCTDLSAWNRGRRMLCLPKEWLSKGMRVSTAVLCCAGRLENIYLLPAVPVSSLRSRGYRKRSVASGNTCAVAISFRNFLITHSAPLPPHFLFPLTDSQCQAFARISLVIPFTSAVAQLFSTVPSLESRFL